MRLFFILIFLIGISSCSPKPSGKENTLAQISDPEVMKYAVNGKRLYENHCANCHQNDGSGLGKLIPPLKNADYFKESIHRTVWIIRYGQEGPIQVNGTVFNQKMPENSSLKPLDIAQIVTYLYNIWEMEEGVISAPEVEKFLKTPPENL